MTRDQETGTLVEPQSRLQQLLRDYSHSIPDLTITGLALDSRKVKSGFAYFALPGTQAHGLDFAEEAISAGARAILVDVDDPADTATLEQHGVAVVRVENLSHRVGEIAARYHGNVGQGIEVCGVTGTDGKTSVCRFISSALEQLGHGAGYIGTIGWGAGNELQPNPLTTPDPVRLQQMVAELTAAGVSYICMEVSSHALVQGRVSGVNFDLAILTNLGRDHLDYHGTLDNYKAAKRQLFDWPDLSGVIVNGDDAFGQELAASLRSSTPVTRFGLDADSNDINAINVDASEQGYAFTLIEQGEPERQVQSQLLGEFNVRNLLACYSALRAFGIAAPDAAAVLAKLKPVDGRMEHHELGGVHAVIDYSHTPQALEAALDALRPHCRAQLWVVFGCGGDRDPGKRPQMAAVAEQFADQVVVTDDNPRSEPSDLIINDILAGFGDSDRATVLPDRREAITHAVQNASQGDWILVAGKGHEDYQLVGDQRLAFSDRECLLSLHPHAATRDAATDLEYSS